MKHKPEFIGIIVIIVLIGHTFSCVYTRHKHCG